MSKESLQPMGDKVVLKATVETMSSGGVIIPDLAQENTMVAEVIAVGPGGIGPDGKRIPMECSIGDKVVFAKFAAHRFEFEDQEYIVMREADMMTRIGEPNKALLKG